MQILALWLCLRLCQFKIFWDTLAFKLLKRKKWLSHFWAVLKALSLFDYSQLCNQGNKNFGNPRLKHPSNGFLMWTNLTFSGDQILDISLLIKQNHFWFCKISSLKLRFNFEIFWQENLMNPIPNSCIPNEHFTLLIQFVFSAIYYEY